MITSKSLELVFMKTVRDLMNSLKAGSWRTMILSWSSGHAYMHFVPDLSTKPLGGVCQFKHKIEYLRLAVTIFEPFQEDNGLLGK